MLARRVAVAICFALRAFINPVGAFAQNVKSHYDKKTNFKIQEICVGHNYLLIASTPKIERAASTLAIIDLNQ